MSDLLLTLTNLHPLLELLTTVLWGLYVLYTIRTFREIRRQTDLQSEAFLVVACNVVDALDDPRSLSRPDGALVKKWQDILRDRIPNAVRPARIAVLELTNRGKSDVVDWEIQVTLEIKPGQYLRDRFNTVGERISWPVKYSGNRDNIPPQGTIKVPIAFTGIYPESHISWSIRYGDTRDVQYVRFAGDRALPDRNVLAEPSK